MLPVNPLKHVSVLSDFCPNGAIVYAVDLQLQAEFFQNDHLGDQVQEEEQKYDVVTCMFALHYFFETKDMLSTFFQNVALNLKEGGSAASVQSIAL